MYGDSGIMRVGIVGAGRIADKIARTLCGMQTCRCSAVASRSLERAQAFADKWGIPAAFGSYEELLSSDDVDLVYIATPHSHHMEPTMSAIAHGKPCLVEKAFMANARQAREVLAFARERKVFVAEAIWTRYQPAVGIIRGLLDNGAVGEVKMIGASLGYNVVFKERIMKRELCGGALLDVGVYPLNFLRMFHPGEPVRTLSSCQLSDGGIDLQNSITMYYGDGLMANMQSSVCSENDKKAVISGSEGFMVIDNVNNPQLIRVFAGRGTLKEEIHVPDQITGYEYEFEACRKAIMDGRLEPEEMPHEETLRIMDILDSLREAWGVRYPFD